MCRLCLCLSLFVSVYLPLPLRLCVSVSRSLALCVCVCVCVCVLHVHCPAQVGGAILRERTGSWKTIFYVCGGFQLFAGLFFGSLAQIARKDDAIKSS